MSVFLFTKGPLSFGVTAHNEIRGDNEIKADEPIILEYATEGEAPIRSQFSMRHGMPFAEVEMNFRKFVKLLPAT